MARKRVRGHKHAIRDLIIIVFSVVTTALLARYGIIAFLVSLVEEWAFLASFVAGMFFTSMFTIAPATLALAELSDVVSAFSVILWGAAGAVAVDVVLMMFIRDTVAEDVKELMAGARHWKMRRIFRLRLFRRFMPFIGALIIIIPFLPDEVGLALMGLSGMRTMVAIPILYSMNALGILSIVLSVSFFG